MGGKRKRKSPSIPPGVRAYQQFASSVKKAPPIDISGFEKKISETIEGKINQDIEKYKQESLSKLRVALANALGSLQYDPYSKQVLTAIEKIRSGRAEKLMPLKEQIITQYKGISPQIGSALMAAGGYTAVPAMRQPDETKARSEYLRYLEEGTKPSYEAIQRFFTDTKQMLSDLGLPEEEIESTLSPYYEMMERGKSLAMSIYGGL